MSQVLSVFAVAYLQCLLVGSCVCAVDFTPILHFEQRQMHNLIRVIGGSS